MQRVSLRISLICGLLSVLAMYALAALPALRLWGAVMGFGAAQVLTLALNLLALRHADGSRPTPPAMPDAPACARGSVRLLP